MGNRIILIGGKGTAVNIALQISDAQHRCGMDIALHGFAIDDESLGSEIAGFPVVCKTRDLATMFVEEPYKLIFCLYRTDVMQERTALLESYHLPPWRFTNFVHPSAFVAASSLMGTGNVLMSNSTLHHQTQLGDFNIINSNAVIEHDSRIGNSNFISACACIGSKVRIGNGCFVGLNATVREEVTIGDFALIGMGSNVVGPVGSMETHFGNPARRRR